MIYNKKFIARNNKCKMHIYVFHFEKINCQLNIDKRK